MVFYSVILSSVDYNLCYEDLGSFYSGTLVALIFVGLYLLCLEDFALFVMWDLRLLYFGNLGYFVFF